MTTITYKRSISKYLPKKEPEKQPEIRKPKVRTNREEKIIAIPPARRSNPRLTLDEKNALRLKRYKQFIGVKINMLTALEFSYLGINTTTTKLKCLCDCGLVKDVNFSNFKSGQLKSCGCLGGRGKAWETRRKNQNVQQGSECSKESCETITNG
ncbi:hypothetical protein LGL98_13630 [Klebsiella africana]|uniref:hypothetical protein n=1 Tax=Klebsiella africana TaxID=2489010 RepID=UPI00109BDF8E|nr:hypothetical protein [Klebsiella africana]UDD38284.1 hypothetical protein LGL98_13630 [Klebsiella africana]